MNNSDKTFDVRITLTDGTQIVRRGLDDETASAYEDLPFTSTDQKVAMVEVTEVVQNED